MGYGGMFYWIPLWALYVGTVLLILISLELGYRLSKVRLKKKSDFRSTNLGSMVGATLGLLAFILAISFGAGIERFETRKKVMIEEVNAIGTTYRRTDLLTPPSGQHSRELLLEYVTVRLDSVFAGNLQYALKRSEAIHDELWAVAIAETVDTAASEYKTIYIDALNNMIDMHLVRLTAGLRSPIPWIIWVALYVIMCICMMTIGFEAGIGGAYKSLVVIAMAFVFASVIYLIADLERPSQGLVKLEYAPLFEQKAAFEADLSGN